MVTTRTPRLILAAFLMLAAPAAQAQLGLVSQSQELQAAREADAQITQQYRVSRDSNYNNLLRTLGTRLTRVCERSDLPWTFRVLDSNELNAFSVPGFVYVTTTTIDA